MLPITLYIIHNSAMRHFNKISSYSVRYCIGTGDETVGLEKEWCATTYKIPELLHRDN